MRTLTQFINESALEVQENTINFIPVNDLEKYLKIAGKCLSEDAKLIIQWLIDNNDTYMKTYGGNKTNNALVNFYEKGVPSDASLKPLYKAIGTLAKKRRLNEVPVFQSEDEFNDIINKKVAPDEVILDFETEQGRNHIAKLYDPLVHKICHQFHGKSNLSYDELYSAAQMGLAYAIQNYGKASSKTKAEGEDAVKRLTFGQYAAYMIRNVGILEAIKDESRTVRVARSAQQKEKAERGHISRSNTVSGEQVVGHDKDGNSKTLFDTIGSSEDASKNLDQQDIDKLWKKINDDVKSQFSARDLDIFYSFTGLNNTKKIGGKELAKKYNIAASNVTAIVGKIKTYMYKKHLKDLELLNDLYHECLQHKYEENDDVYIISYEKNTDVE